ncbi:MAG: isoprenyl transferase [bacterium]
MTPAADPSPTPRVPLHVAIVMDGNGRWAKQRGLPRIKGHEQGAESVRAVMRAARTAGIKYLTLYAFSVENWSRPKAEVNFLMRLIPRFAEYHEKDLHENKTRLRAMGRLADIPGKSLGAITAVMKRTEKYQDRHLILALSYGSRTEIVEAVKRIAGQVKSGNLEPEDITETTVSANLYMPDVPDPDLIIRTSGEMRLSNFLLWQASYSELYVTDTLWPDFREADFRKALDAYAKRQRRFGKIG